MGDFKQGTLRPDQAGIAWCVLSLAVLTLGFPIADADAQVVAQARPEEQPGRDVGTTTQAGSAAAASQGLLEDLGPPISYAEILAHPDDVDLNYTYALQQARAGDLRGAATTLERILLVNPDLPQVRLLYAITLFRLDSTDEAVREFQAVRQMPVSDDVKAEIDRYLDQIALRQKVTRFAASISLGADFNTNKDAAPRSEFRLFGGTPIVVPGGRHDTGRIAIGTFEVHHDLQTQERDELFARATGYYDNQVQVKTQDLKATAFEAGGVMHRDYATFTPSLLFTDIELANHHYLMSPGAKLLTERKLDAKTDVYLVLQGDHQHFFDNPVSVAVVSQTGWRWTAQAGANYILTPTMRIGGALRHTIDRAIDSFDAYTTDEVALSHTWLLGKGQFLLSGLTYGIDRYDIPDPAVAAVTRRDNTLRLRTTYGAPLDTIASALGAAPLPKEIGDVILTLTLEGTWAQSTLTNFAYTNYKSEMLFTKRWEF